MKHLTVKREGNRITIELKLTGWRAVAAWIITVVLVLGGLSFCIYKFSDPIPVPPFDIETHKNEA